MTRLHRRAALALVGAALLGRGAPARAQTNVATPSPLREDLALRHYEILDDRAGGELRVLGEYQNTGKTVIVAPVLRLALTDAAGAPLETDELFPADGRLPPGQTGGFSGIVRLARGAWTHERLIACQTELPGPADLDAALAVRRVVAVVKTDALLHVTGELANTGPTAVSGVRVRAIITRAKDDHFAGIGSTAIDGPIPAQTTVVFSLSVSSADMPGIEPGDAYTYRLAPRRTTPLSVQCGA